jgi:hypothetical protein
VFHLIYEEEEHKEGHGVGRGGNKTQASGRGQQNGTKPECQ